MGNTALQIPLNQDVVQDLEVSHSPDHGVVTCAVTLTPRASPSLGYIPWMNLPCSLLNLSTFRLITKDGVCRFRCLRTAGKWVMKCIQFIQLSLQSSTSVSSVERFVLKTISKHTTESPRVICCRVKNHSLSKQAHWDFWKKTLKQIIT